MAMDLELWGVRNLGVLGPRRKRGISCPMKEQICGSRESLRKSLVPKKALVVISWVAGNPVETRGLLEIKGGLLECGRLSCHLFSKVLV